MTSPWTHNDLPEYENVYGKYNEALFKFGDIIEINQASKNNFVSPNSFNNSSMVLDWINLEANIYQTCFLISLFWKNEYLYDCTLAQDVWKIKAMTWFVSSRKIIELRVQNKTTYFHSNEWIHVSF